jgi:hypothetical protein
MGVVDTLGQCLQNKTIEKCTSKVTSIEQMLKMDEALKTFFGVQDT